MKTNIKTKYLIIGSFFKCDNLDSKMILNNIILFAKEIKVLQISLIDASSISFENCHIRLSMLYILLYGMSWYNKFGLISDNYHNEILNNNIKNNLNLESFIDQALLNKKNREINIINEEYIIELKNYITKINNSNNLNKKLNSLLINKYYSKLTELLSILNKDYYITEKEYNYNTLIILVNQIENHKSYNDINNDNIRWYKEFLDSKINNENNEKKNEIKELFNKIKNNYTQINDNTKINDIVKIIHNAKKNNCSSIELQFLIEITDIANYIFLYDSQLKMILPQNTTGGVKIWEKGKKLSSQTKIKSKIQNQSENPKSKRKSKRRTLKKHRKTKSKSKK
jgi:hypothetical protein